MDKELNIRRLASGEKLDACFEIRRIVFIEGQNVPPDREVDGLDPDSWHYLAEENGRPIATARVRFEEGYAKIERVAVLDSYQGKGIGRHLMVFILDDLRRNSPCRKAKLGSQNHAMPFYERLGFHVAGDEYMDAGIPHHDMALDF